MRAFVVLGHTAPTTPEFSLDDLAGGAGRLDVLCRCVNSALFLSHDIREAVEIQLVLQDTLTVSFQADALRGVAPDERNIAAHLRNALEAASEAVGHQAVTSSPGISVAKQGFESVLSDFAPDRPVLQLHATGDPITTLDPPDSPVFVLSDHEDFSPRESERLASAATRQVTLGPERLHADHAITIAHNYLDTDGYSAYD